MLIIMAFMKVVGQAERIRSESQFYRQDVVVWMRKYVDILWKGIDESLKYFDKDGSTCWSEAPAEGIFSILAYITENRASLTPSHLSKLCRTSNSRNT